MVDLLVAAAEVFAGIAVGFAAHRRPGAWGAVVVMLVSAACIAVVVYGSTTPQTCQAGSDCQPVTAVDLAWVGAALLGLWVVPVAMGYAVSVRLRGL